MKVKIQVNGESSLGQDIESLEKYGMIDSEYELIAEMKEKDIDTLEDLLGRAIDDGSGELFNYHIMIL